MLFYWPRAIKNKSNYVSNASRLNNLKYVSCQSSLVSDLNISRISTLATTLHSKRLWAVFALTVIQWFSPRVIHRYRGPFRRSFFISTNAHAHTLSDPKSVNRTPPLPPPNTDGRCFYCNIRRRRRRRRRRHRRRRPAVAYQRRR
jgi:hypothetical protein